MLIVKPRIVNFLVSFLAETRRLALFNSHIEQHTSTYRKDGDVMINKGFPTFGTTQDGVHLSTLKNYNLPDFILKMVAAECDSELLEKGRMDDRLQSMNEDALKMLYRIFVDCEDDGAGRFAQYRFYAYISSAFHKCEILVDEAIPGESQKNHKFPVAVKSKGMYIAVAYNKSTGNPISKRGRWAASMTWWMMSSAGSTAQCSPRRYTDPPLTSRRMP